MLNLLRVSMLVAEECSIARLHVYHDKAYLLLRISTKEIRK
jgi:hypothetical protein